MRGTILIAGRRNGETYFHPQAGQIIIADYDTPQLTLCLYQDDADLAWVVTEATTGLALSRTKKKADAEQFAFLMAIDYFKEHTKDHEGTMRAQQQMCKAAYEVSQVREVRNTYRSYLKSAFDGFLSKNST